MMKEPTVSLVPERPGHLFPGGKLGLQRCGGNHQAHVTGRQDSKCLLHINVPAPGEAHTCSQIPLPLADHIAGGEGFS